jgi:hypothetical protein
MGHSYKFGSGNGNRTHFDLVMSQKRYLTALPQYNGGLSHPSPITLFCTNDLSLGITVLHIGDPIFE